MSRKKIVAGNWKMNLTLAEAVSLAKALGAAQDRFACEVMIFPPFLYLTKVKSELQESRIEIGAQNCAAHENGAFTGEVSAAMLASAGIDTVLVGHSERRELFGETDAVLKKKLRLALAHKLKIVFCCGEPLSVRQENKQNEFVLRQLQESLFCLSDEDMLRVTIAYEPVWAIGTGLNAAPEQVQDMHHYVRSALATHYGRAIAQQTPILYGGSCKPDNASQLFSCPDVDGGLIGGASLKANDFIAIIDAA